ncbi:hypothetical protein KCP74_05330 [Salmonella enterica subsp. enterica]|nr:hypothetical protein KCP74_05330 [Salmonella enterica subsp. enterica]
MTFRPLVRSEEIGGLAGGDIKFVSGYRLLETFAASRAADVPAMPCNSITGAFASFLATPVASDLYRQHVYRARYG